MSSAPIWIEILRGAVYVFLAAVVLACGLALFRYEVEPLLVLGLAAAGVLVAAVSYAISISAENSLRVRQLLEEERRAA